MCGIIGYIGDKRAVPFLIEGLKRLEYRGYDSAGLCVLEKGELKNVKKQGRVSELEKQAELPNLSSTLGIAHTRWATHGEPSEVNAHPHLDCKGEIAVVHNGIIENYQALKTLLVQEGHKIASQTDTEIIAHLIEKFYDGDLEKAVVKTIKLLEGAFGLAILHKNEPRIVVARKGSPLILGIGEGETFVASDAAAILSHTKKVIYLNDNEIAVLEKDGFSVKDADGGAVEKEVQELKWNAEQIEKKGFKHFMLKEIFEQPEAMKNTLRGRVKSDHIKLSVTVGPKTVKRAIILACGTSYYAGLAGKYIIESVNRIPVEAETAPEFRYKDPIIREGDLAIAISQSGETADTIGALREAKKKGAQTLGIVNVVGSTIARDVDSGIYLHAGPEIGVAATKAFTCQLVALNLLSLYLQQINGAAVEQTTLKELWNIPEKIKLILGQSEKIREISSNFRNASNFLFLGRGLNFPVALEGALKLKECSYIHAEGYPAAEMKHGPIALIDENMPVVFLATKDRTYEKILSNMEEVKARKGRIIAVVNEPDEKIARLSEYVIEVPATEEMLSPILNVIPLQLLAYYIADLKGIDVDKPRNLAKSVTVE